ncbi:Bifunctional lysine-specific demethylase and histidyl-hydroxylase NO66 (Histone lysine demethylase NO66) [Durusdinium trenchii]|uniref:Bifunctional lysine-specific demethylase and histidyl-hydroxylase n=1 Tax=Durusdinium trenchii TaxID=1381693 RepID=A0ABP0ML85_9DINO
MARRYFASPWVEAQRARLQRLVDCAASSASSEPPRALDVGCGRGRHSLMLLEMGFQVTAVDLDGEALDTLRQRERGAVEKGTLKIRSMDLEAEDVGALGHFDVLLVVNYASRSLLPKLLQLLKPKGLLIFESWAQGNEHFATPKDAEAQRRLLRANELLEATSDCFTVLAYSHGLQEDYEGRDCVKQMICAEKRPCPGRASPVSEASRWCLGRLLEVTDASFLQDSAFGRDWVWHRPQSLGVAFGIEDLLQLLDGYDPEAAQKEYLAALTSASPRGARPALWDVSMVRRRESTTETLKPQEVRDFLRAAQLKTSADVLQRGEGWTLVVSQLQGAPALCDLHQRLFAATGLSSGINAYLTPPDAIGKPPHVDDHDVLVLQLAGSKTWTLLDDARQTIREQVPLTKGDVMYLPQGIPHHAAAMASHEASLHLAVALHRRPMSYSSVLGALVTLRLMDPGDGDLLPAALVEEMEGRSQSFAAFGAREHWINQLLPMHLALVRALSPEDLDVGLRREFCAVLRQRSRDLAELLRSPDMEDADLGMPVGARRQRALLRASVRGSERDLEEAAQLPEEDFEALACAAFWVRREYVMDPRGWCGPVHRRGATLSSERPLRPVQCLAKPPALALERSPLAGEGCRLDWST